MVIDEEHRTRVSGYDFTDIQRYTDGARLQPTFFYESAWNLAGFGLLYWVSRRFEERLRDGDIGAPLARWRLIAR